MEGIYDNGNFGCIGRGKFTGRKHFPRHDMKHDDLVIVNDAHWTMAFCEGDRYSAYAFYLPKYLDFFSVSNQPLKVFITSPPWNPLKGGNHCKRRTNINLSWANQLGSSVATARSWHVFDAWSRLMPIYNTTCDPAHYICTKTRGKKVSLGGTGTIVVDALWEFLLNI